MKRTLSARKFGKVWTAAALPGEAIRYGFLANPSGTASVQAAGVGKVVAAGVLFGAAGAMVASAGTSGKINTVRGGSEHFPMDSYVAVAVGSHRLRVWSASSRGRPDRLLGDVAYQSIAAIHLKQVKAGRSPVVGDVSLTFADRSRTSFETDLKIAEAFVAMVLPVIGGPNAVREESLQHRQAVAEMHARAESLRSAVRPT